MRNTYFVSGVVGRVTGMRKRIYVGGVWHETHTFAATRTTLSDFEAHQLVQGDLLIERFAGTQTEIGGALAALDGKAEVVPGYFAGAMPSGLVDPRTWEAILRELLESVRRASADAVFLAVHGAMVCESDPDPEGTLLERVREVVGPGVPVGVTLDSHANVGPKVVENADILSAYDTYPHTDFADRGREVAALLLEALQGKTFARALVQLPLAPPVLAQQSSLPPVRELIALAHAVEAIPGFEIVSWAPGFPYSDVERMGMSLIITASAGTEAAGAMARGLASAAWAAREGFRARLTPVEDAVAQALSAPEGPVVLVDVADNIGGGAPGDGTALLRELVRRNAAGSVVSIADAGAARAAVAAGQGARIELEVGGKSDGLHGPPVSIRGVVRWCGDGTFTLTGSWMKGLVVKPGLSARIETDEGVSVIVSERKVPPFDSGEIRRAGIDPERCRIIVAKSAIAWQAAYGAFAKKAIYVDTPGICTPYCSRLPFARRRRPLYPLDDDAAWEHARCFTFPPRAQPGPARRQDSSFSG